LFLIVAPILIGQNAVASLLPCEKMALEKEVSINARHEGMNSMAELSSDDAMNCSCDQNSCSTSHSVSSATLNGTSSLGANFEVLRISFSVKSSPQFGVRTPPFRPPIIS